MNTQLSPRELQIVRMAAQGMLNKEIGEELRISIRTVHSHIENARIKLGAKNRCHVVYLAFVVPR
jgi:DNA-binding CsgD family transcriptional regulator